MLDTHHAVPTGALRPTESRALLPDPNGKGRIDSRNRYDPTKFKELLAIIYVSTDFEKHVNLHVHHRSDEQLVGSTLYIHSW